MTAGSWMPPWASATSAEMSSSCNGASSSGPEVILSANSGQISSSVAIDTFLEIPMARAKRFGS